MKCVGARTQDEKMRRIITKTNNGRSFQLVKSQLWLGPYRQQKSFRYTAKIGLWQIFWQSIFDLSEEKCHYHSHWIRNFLFLFSFFSLSRKVLNVTVRKRYGILNCFSRHNPRNSDKWPWIENGEDFAVHLSTWPSGVKDEWSERRVTYQRWLTISNAREKNLIFSRVLVRIFSGM